MLAQPFGRACPEDQLGGGGEAGLRHPLHAPLLCQFRRDAREPGRLRTLSGPFTRRKVVCVRSELDGKARARSWCRDPTPTRSGDVAPPRGIRPGRLVGDCASGLPPGSAVRIPPLSPTNTDVALGAI
jgi:hypothetical protein